MLFMTMRSVKRRVPPLLTRATRRCHPRAPPQANTTLFLLLLCLLEETIAKNNKCTGQSVTTYKKEMVKANLDNPREFAMDKGLNMLYFSNGPDGQLVQIHLGTRKLTNIEIVESRSQVVNQVTHEVYIAPETRIYKYNPKAKEVDIVVDESINVASMYFYNSTLYFTECWLNHVHKLNEDKIESAEEILMQKHDHFVIDHDGTIFFTSDDQLYSINVKGDKVKYFETVGFLYRGLAVDNDGNILACTYYGIFQLNKEDKSLEGIVPGETRYCSGLATDRNNNIIYSDGKSVYKLKKKTECIQLDKSLNKHRRLQNVTFIPVHNMNWTLFMTNN